MVSKKELQEQIDKLARENGKLDREAWRLGLDNRAHREREKARMARDHAEQQRERQEAEREDKRTRRQELSDGLLRIRDAFEWSFEHKVGEGPVLHLSVALDGDTYPIVHGVIDKLNAPPRTLGAPGSIHITTNPVTVDWIDHALKRNARFFDV